MLEFRVLHQHHRRTLDAKGEVDKKTQSVATQPGRRKHASENPDVGSATNASYPPADLRSAGPLPDDPGSTLQTGHSDQRDNAFTDVNSQSLACGIQRSEAPSFALNSGSITSLSFGQQNASTSRNDLQAPQNTAIPISMPWRPQQSCHCA
jgi:hypothetical protein